MNFVLPLPLRAVRRWIILVNGPDTFFYLQQRYKDFLKKSLQNVLIYVINIYLRVRNQKTMNKITTFFLL